MSYVFNMIYCTAGGGGPTASDAILTVTAPAGSTVTATKGGTTLTPTLWTAAADATQECALFVIAPAQFDSSTPWTVTISDGTNTASDTILINSNKQYWLSLDYNLWFVKNGVLCTTFTLSAEATLTQETDFVLFRATVNKYARISTGQTDLTDYSRLKLVLRANTSDMYGYSYSGAYYPSLGYGSRLPSSDTVPNYTDYIKLNSTSGNILQNSFTIDLTSSTGLAYISLLISGTAGVPGVANIYNFYLERS